MKKLLILLLIPTMLFCGCKDSERKSITQTRILMDTVCTVTADCSKESINGSLDLCEKLDRLFSRHRPESEVSLLNHTDEGEISKETLEVLAQAIYYCQKTGGKYDITITPALNLYDFEKQKAPTEEEAKKVLYKVGYNRIEVNGNKIDLHNTDIDFGSIAKGYAADKMVKYLKDKGAKNGIVNLGGNVAVFGKEYKVGIKKPFSDNEVMLTVKLKNKSAATSGIYERGFEKDGKFYHHILDVKTGMPIDNDLASVTILGEKASECDVLSTVCMILGEKNAKKLINETSGYEAVFIKKDNSVSVSKGLKIKDKQVVYK